MKKKFLFVVLWILTVVSAFCIGKSFKAESVNVSENVVEVDKFEYDRNIYEISVDEVNGITQQEAENKCYDVLGDKDTATRYKFSYKCTGAVEKDGKNYYVIDVLWLVDGNHWSYVTTCFVLYDGSEIYDGMVKKAEYVFANKIWNK